MAFEDFHCNTFRIDQIIPYISFVGSHVWPGRFEWHTLVFGRVAYEDLYVSRPYIVFKGRGSERSFSHRVNYVSRSGSRSGVDAGIALLLY